MYEGSKEKGTTGSSLSYQLVDMVKNDPKHTAKKNFRKWGEVQDSYLQLYAVGKGWNEKKVVPPPPSSNQGEATISYINSIIKKLYFCVRPLCSSNQQRLLVAVGIFS